MGEAPAAPQQTGYDYTASAGGYAAPIGSNPPLPKVEDAPFSEDDLPF